MSEGSPFGGHASASARGDIGRVVILGTGAMGCLFAARLALHVEVWMLGTWAAGLAAVRREGVCISEQGETWQAAVRTADDPTAVPTADVVLLLVKSYQTDRAAAWAARCLAPNGLAVTLQNGLDNGPWLAAAVGGDRMAVGVTFEGATLLRPGRVRHAGRGPTYIGAGPEARVRGLVSLLRRAGFDARLASDVEQIVWGKAVVNAAINPLTALWRVPNGDLLVHEDRRALLASLSREAAAVATARGVQLMFEDPIAHVEEVCRATAANRSSMLQDVERGRLTEIDSINGVIVAEGRRLGVPTPVNETVWRLVRGLTAHREN
ncbi:MAG: 2-dehydropantoate 2-reductase [Chloroflexi bacterium]|nr:2-dehydropantoate 2-reductase [Chloroflexota bacterium]